MKKRHVLLVLLLLSVVDFAVFLVYVPMNQATQLPLDIDYIGDGPYAGNFLVADSNGPVRIVSLELEQLWECTLSTGFTHEAAMLPNGNVLLTDTGDEIVMEVNINDPNEIVWQWDARDSNDVNWTEFGIANGWGEDALAYVQDMNPPSNDWTHINDAELINGTKFGRSYDSLLISIRNFDLVVEVNYTDTKEIIWHYGEPTVKELLARQHNPDRLDNGNTIICDSDNHRFIELEAGSNDIVWEYHLDFPNGEFRWGRDCDDLGDGTFLITDSNNARVFLLDKESKEIIREFGRLTFVQPYEADLVMIGGELKILVGDPNLSGIILIDYETGQIQVTGIGWILNFIQVLGVLVVFYYAWRLRESLKETGEETLRDQLMKLGSYREIVHLALTTLLLFLIPSIYRFIWYLGFYHTMEYVTALLW
ncbi:MAG: aryl-sulfate sulfotransferase [Candidatus Thorarchaeota archaeon]